jgi:hypothetical protein
MLMRFPVSLCVLVLVSSGAKAAEIPKQGTVSYTVTYVGAPLSTLTVGERSVTLIELNGVTRSDDGGSMFDAMGTRCLVMREAVGREVSSHGTCVEIDKDGDQIFSTFDGKGAAGRHTFVGGTGKYTGLSGAADYTGQFIKAPDGRIMTIVKHKATWKLSSD